MSKQSVLTRVSSLFYGRGPSTVFGRVVAVIVDAIKRISFFGNVSHISVEIFKRISPSITNDYSATTPIFVSGVFGIVTSLLHMQPCSIYGSSRHTMSKSVSALTATGFARSVFEIIKSNKFFFSTNTPTGEEFTEPSGFSSFLNEWTRNGPITYFRVYFIHNMYRAYYSTRRPYCLQKF